MNIHLCVAFKLIIELLTSTHKEDHELYMGMIDTVVSERACALCAQEDYMKEGGMGRGKGALLIMMILPVVQHESGLSNLRVQNFFKVSICLPLFREQLCPRMNCDIAPVLSSITSMYSLYLNRSNLFVDKSNLL